MTAKLWRHAQIKSQFINPDFAYLSKSLQSDKWMKIKSKEVIIKEHFGPQQGPNVKLIAALMDLIA